MVGSLMRMDERGGVLPIFAISIMLIFGAVGAAIDYSRAAAARTEMQAALDATAILLAKEASELTQAQLIATGFHRNHMING